MTREKRHVQPTRKRAAIIVLSGSFLLSFLGDCNDKLITATQFVDPCGTILNCPRGYFQTVNADIGDWSVDPTCPLPGGCQDVAFDEQALGTIWDLDP